MKKTKTTNETSPEAEVIAEKPAVAEPKVVKEVKPAVNKVGCLLKEMRLQKGLRLPDVAKRLCIRKMYLEAIEESNYKEIPPFPYGVGFIRSYADFLGLNSGNIVELYKEETNTKPDKDIYVLEPQSEATMPNRKYLVISLLAVILIYGLWSIYNNSSSEEEVAAPAEEEVLSEENTPEDMPIVVEDFSVNEEAEEAAPEDTAAPADGRQVTITEESFVEPEPVVVEPKVEQGVVVKITKETWIEVKNANKLYISKVLQPGAEYVVPEGGKGMVLSVGKVDGAEVYINGKLTQVAKPNKKTNIALDPFLSEAH